MANVNLYAGTQKSEQIQNKRKVALGSLMFSLACIIGVLGVFGGVKVWGGMIEGDTAEINSQIEVIRSELTVSGEEMDSLHDMFLRLAKIQKNPTPFDISKSFGQLEGLVVRGVLFSEYLYEKENNSITLSGDAVDFATLLQQMRILRTAEGVHSVALNSVGLSDEGFVLFEIVLSLSQGEVLSLQKNN